MNAFPPLARRTRRPLLSSLLLFVLPPFLAFGPQALPAQVGQGSLTPPEAYLGFKPGADFHLMTYEQAVGYFERLASETDRMIVLDMGETSAGRRMKYGVVSSAENLARLDHFKEVNRRLSLARGLSDEEAHELANEGRTIVWIDGGLHGTEVAPAQLLPQLAYDLVAGEDSTTRAIRENVITLLVFANPDGMTIVSDWYMSNVGTPYEVSPIPWLYHKYVGHDNNRDSFMGNLVETRNMNRATSAEWFPEILYNQHQTGPFPARIWIPPDAEPSNPNVHPLIVRWRNLIGSAMGKAFEENHQPGAISRIRYDSWYPGYATQVVDGHNVISILTETQLYRYATPQFFTVEDFPEAHQELIPGVFYPSPWPGGWWRLGDAVAYNLTACKAVLEVAARYRPELLYDKYRAGVEVIERFQREPPFGYLVSPEQPDRGMTALLIERMMANGIEVYRAQAPFTHNGIEYPRGTFVLPTSQPFGLFLKNIFERQSYPDLRRYPHLWEGLVSPEEWPGGPLRPYDGVGWTLPLQMGVDYQEITAPLEVTLERVEQVEMPGGVRGGGGTYLLSHADHASFEAVFRLLASGARVSWAEESFTAGGSPWPAGTFVVERGRLSQSELRRIAEETGAVFLSGAARGRTTPLRLPRIGLYKSWVASMDAGWMTYLFDTYGVPYEEVTNAGIRAGRLEDRFDVLILPDQSVSQIVDGHAKGTVPPAYAGGIGKEGVLEIREFVEDGGTLICNNASCDLPVERFRLPLRNVLERVRPDSFNCPGALLAAEFRTDHPLAYGMPERGMIFFSRGRAYERADSSAAGAAAGGDASAGTPAEGSGAAATRDVSAETGGGGAYAEEVTIETVASYPNEPLLLSGWMIGDERIREKAAALEVGYGEGRIALFGFNVHNRGQARSTLKLLFNALLHR